MNPDVIVVGAGVSGLVAALELKRGRLALTVENGKVVTLEWRDAAGADAGP